MIVKEEMMPDLTVHPEYERLFNEIRLGFDQNAARVLDYGPRQFQVLLQRDFSLTITAAGKDLKPFPPPPHKTTRKKPKRQRRN
jgi:hypothetical protein